MKRDLAFDVANAPARDLARVAAVCAVALAAIGLLALYWQTAASIVSIWIRSETFAHGFIIVPMCIWLAWRKRAALANVALRPWWPGLAFVLASGALWLVASVADALGPKQFALAFMLQAAIVTIIGLKAARVLAFPLAFLLFAIPFGEFMVPTLIDWTADFTVTALRLSGVPVYREANQFIIPTGRWSVIEACSGVRYIIASVMVGTIYAAVAYRGARRRAVFVAASILVPIIANWLRAYMIVMLGHLSNNRLAVGVDHIIYGWIFFGVVMLLLFWVGSFWQESDAPVAPDDGMPGQDAAPPGNSRPLIAAAMATIVSALVWQPLEAIVTGNAAAGNPALNSIAGANGWTESGARITEWRPRYVGYKAELAQTFTNGNRDVGLFIAYYRDQTKGRELITSGNQLTLPTNWDWKPAAAGRDEVTWAGRPTTVDRAELVGPQMRLEVFRVYWVADRLTSNPYVAKALQAWSKITGGGDDAALIVTYASVDARNDAAREALRAFAGAMSPSIERALSAARDSGR